MADDTRLNSGSGGDLIRSLDRGTAKTQVVALDVGGSDGESLASPQNPLPVDVTLLLRQLLEAIANPTHADPANAALRVLFPSAQAVTISSGTVTTCATVTNLAQIGGVAANSLVMDAADTAWAAVRERYAVT